MPKVKKHDVNPMSVLLYGAMKASGFRMYELADKIGVSLCTLRRWMARPEYASLNTIKRLCKILGIPKEDFVNAWKW